MENLTNLFNSILLDDDDDKIFHGNMSLYALYNCVKAKKCFSQNKYEETVFHLSECHGGYIRLDKYCGLPCKFSYGNKPNLDYNYFSFTSSYHSEKVKGLKQRLLEMPSEWTVVQLTRCPLQNDPFTPPEASPKLEDFFFSRLPCGSELKNVGCLLTSYLLWPAYQEIDVLDCFTDAKIKLKEKYSNKGYEQKKRIEVLNFLKNYLESIPNCLWEYQCWLLGRIQNNRLEADIRKRMDNIIDRYGFGKVNQMKRYQMYLLAESCFDLPHDIFYGGVKRLFPEEEFLNLVEYLFEGVAAIKRQLPHLENCQRHPTILIIDGFLDVIPWESTKILLNHPVTRIPSIHFLHALYKFHEPYIKNGLREIEEDMVSYYVLDPDDNIPSLSLKDFMSKRLPTWKKTIGQKPSPEEWVEAVTSYNSFFYCGHGSGSQYVKNVNIGALNISSVQLLFGCSSGALKHIGGDSKIVGDTIPYLMAGSCCILGMLFAVTSYDTDCMTKVLANLWLPGRRVNLKTLEYLEDPVEIDACTEKELLRTLKYVRTCCKLWTNGVALIARGLPCVLVKSNPDTPKHNKINKTMDEIFDKDLMGKEGETLLNWTANYVIRG